MVGKWKRSKSPRPTPPVCKKAEPGPTTIGAPCPPISLNVGIAIAEFLHSGTTINATTGAVATKDLAASTWRSTSVVLGLDIVAIIEHDNIQKVFRAAGEIQQSGLLIGTFGWPTTPNDSCPRFDTGPLTTDIIPGPGRVTIRWTG